MSYQQRIFKCQGNNPKHCFTDSTHVCHILKRPMSSALLLNKKTNIPRLLTATAAIMQSSLLCPILNAPSSSLLTNIEDMDCYLELPKLSCWEKFKRVMALPIPDSLLNCSKSSKRYRLNDAWRMIHNHQLTQLDVFLRRHKWIVNTDLQTLQDPVYMSIKNSFASRLAPRTLLEAMLYQKKLNVAYLLLKRGAKITRHRSTIPYIEASPLHFFAYPRSSRIKEPISQFDADDMAKELVDAGVHIDSIDSEGRTPLHIALIAKDRSMIERERLVKALLRHGASPTIMYNGKTCRQLAEESGLSYMVPDRYDLSPSSTPIAISTSQSETDRTTEGFVNITLAGANPLTPSGGNFSSNPASPDDSLPSPIAQSDDKTALMSAIDEDAHTPVQVTRSNRRQRLVPATKNRGFSED